MVDTGACTKLWGLNRDLSFVEGVMVYCCSCRLKWVVIIIMVRKFRELYSKVGYNCLQVRFNYTHDFRDCASRFYI